MRNSDLHGFERDTLHMWTVSEMCKTTSCMFHYNNSYVVSVLAMIRTSYAHVSVLAITSCGFTERKLTALNNACCPSSNQACGYGCCKTGEYCTQSLLCALLPPTSSRSRTSTRETSAAASASTDPPGTGTRETSATEVDAGEDKAGLSRSDKIAIGVGLGVGIPALFLAFLTWRAAR